MTSSDLIIALDQGTTSSRAVAYDTNGQRVAIASNRLKVDCPHDGWVEQSAEEIWSSQQAALGAVVEQIELDSVKAIGITNQRETIVAWSRTTGRPLCPAIVWQCRRSASICEGLREKGKEAFVRKETGLVLDPYFSASKIAWMLEHYPEVRKSQKAGDVLFGTVDSWVLYCLSKENGAVHATEPSNASRTMLYSIRSGKWTAELCSLFGVIQEQLPEIKNSMGEFARVKIDNVEIPVTAMLGDQQASLLGHGCTSAGAAKCTFGTGAFMLLQTGKERIESADKMLSTVSWQNVSGQRLFALEGSIFVAGALVDWLCNDLELINSVVESEAIAESVKNSNGVVLVPAFVGLGAPYWDDKARGTIFGLTRSTKKAHIVRAALEGVANQVADVLEADGFSRLERLFIDGGMGSNKLFAQILADICNKPVSVSHDHEKTARGVAIAASVGAGMFQSVEEASEVFLEAECHQFGTEHFEPRASDDERETLRVNWKEAVARTGGWIRGTSHQP